MTKKKSSSLGKTIIKYLLVVPAIFSLTNNIIMLMKLELACMRRKLIVFAILAIFSMALFLTFWLSLNVILYVYLVSINISILMSYVLLAVLNLLLLIISALCMALLNIDASFPETRKAVQQIFSD